MVQPGRLTRAWTAAVRSTDFAPAPVGDQAAVGVQSVVCCPDASSGAASTWCTPARFDAAPGLVCAADVLNASVAAVITDPGGIGIDAHRSPANWVIQDERPICGGSIFFHVVVLGQ